MKPEILKKLALLARADGMSKLEMISHLKTKCEDQSILDATVTEVCDISEQDFSEIKKSFVQALTVEWNVLEKNYLSEIAKKPALLAEEMKILSLSSKDDMLKRKFNSALEAIKRKAEEGYFNCLVTNIEKRRSKIFFKEIFWSGF